jgi:hypothetical protein
MAERLAEILNRQISLARAGRIDDVVNLASQVDELMAGDPRQFKEISNIKSIRDLFDKLQLILGVAKQEISEELGGLRKGKTSLKAYRTASR